MNFNLYLEDELGRKVNSIIKETGRKRNEILREAIANWVKEHFDKKWPASITNFEGCKDYIEPQDLRSELKKPNDKGFF
jgi:predicted transcriptional regulator